VLFNKMMIFSKLTSYVWITFFTLAFGLKYQSFENWVCIDCGQNPAMIDHIYGVVRRAMHTESRETYLNFDHSWIDEALKSAGEKKVIVQLVHREKLHRHVVTSPDTTTTTTFDEDKDHVYVVVSLPVVIPTQADAHAGLPYREALKIDQFLTSNPCWMPLRDPVVRMYSAEYPIENDLPDLPSKLPTIAEHPELLDTPIIDLPSLSMSELNHVYQMSAVFIRLVSIIIIVLG